MLITVAEMIRDRIPIERLLLGVAAVLVLASACTASNEVVTDDTPTASTIAEAESATTTLEPASSNTTSPTSTTRSTATPTVAPTRLPGVETIGDVEQLPGDMVINLDPSVITVLVAPLTTLIDATEAGVRLTQPNWSPNGELVAWARGTEDGSGSVVVGSVVDGSTIVYPAPIVPFYLQWRDDSRAIALLGGVAGPTGPETGLAILDLETGSATLHHSSSSFYLDWSPDGAAMITHLDLTRLEVYDVDGQAATPLANSNGRFQAAQWMPDGSAVLYVRPAGIEATGSGGLLVAQTLSFDELVRQDPTTNEIEILARAAQIASFSVSPNGARVAYTSSRSDGNRSMTVLELGSLDTQTFNVTIIELWQWSPDSEKILLMAYDVGTETISYRVWTGSEVVEYLTSTPTRTFLTRYLVFWGQYSRSHSLWAPDSSAFTFAALDAGGEYVFLQRLTENLPARVSEGSISTFSPVDR